jgi:hypothetical protein
MWLAVSLHEQPGAIASQTNTDPKTKLRITASFEGPPLFTLTDRPVGAKEPSEVDVGAVVVRAAHARLMEVLQ